MAGAYATERRDARNAYLSQYPFELLTGGLGTTLATLTTTSGTTSRAALAGTGDQVMVQNFGNFPAHIAFGTSSIVATSSYVVIVPNLPYTLTIPDGTTHVAGLVASATGTTSVNIVRGYGN